MIAYLGIFFCHSSVDNRARHKENTKLDNPNSLNRKEENTNFDDFSRIGKRQSLQ
jgi:hypothetical protein